MKRATISTVDGLFRVTDTGRSVHVELSVSDCDHECGWVDYTALSSYDHVHHINVLCEAIAVFNETRDTE